MADLLASAGPLLDALEGVAYATAPDGLILAVGASNWARFADENGAPGLDAVGRNLFDLIQGEPVRQLYAALHQKVLRGDGGLHFDYRCDGPAVERLMRMAIGPIQVAGRVEGVLYHSTLISTRDRVPLPYLAACELRDRIAAEGALPVVTVCAWCAEVSDGAGGWVEPAEHYRRGGAERVRLSHGVCPECKDRVLALAEDCPP